MIYGIIAVIIIILTFITSFILGLVANVPITGGAENDLQREYQNWSITDQQLKIIESGLTPKQQYEARNILERWKLSSINFADTTDKMRAELIDKRIHMDNVDEIIAAMKKVKCIPPRDERFVVKDMIKYGEFTQKIPRDRLKLLKKYGTDRDILKCALRYAAIVSGGQQWAIPKAVYKVLIENYGVRVEGFASPFNSRVLPFKEKYPDIQYCSLFKTDDIFGSAGNFFDYNFVDKVTVINPPFIEDILDASIDKIIDQCKLAKQQSKTIRAFIITPLWQDASFYKKLMSSGFIEKFIIYKSGEHYYESPEDIKITAHSDSLLTILSYGLDSLNYKDVDQTFKVT